MLDLLLEYARTCTERAYLDPDCNKGIPGYNAWIRWDEDIHMFRIYGQITILAERIDDAARVLAEEWRNEREETNNES